MTAVLPIAAPVGNVSSGLLAAMKALKKIADECLLTDLKCFRAGLVGEIQGWNHLRSDKMKNTSFGFLAFLFLVLGTSSTTLVAGNQDGAEPYLLKGQFELPLNIDEIREQWTVLGYRECLIQRKHKGWTSDRPERLKGEHTHPWYTLFAGKMGKMEFIIQGQRFVLEPGDELYYPKDAVIAAKNIHDGPSDWFACWKHL